MKTRQIFTWVAILAVLVPSMTFAQNSEARFGTDSATCVINLSLYREFAKQKNYKDAYKPWKWVYHNCPRAMQSIYLDGLRIMDSRLQHEKNVEKRNHTIDTILMIYDGRIKYFPVNTSTGKSQEGYLLGRKGMDAFLYRQDKPEEAFNILKSAVEIDGKETPIDVMQFYFNSVVAMVQKGSVDKSAIVDVYDQLSEMLENSINAETDSTVLNELYFARNNVEKLFEPYATCEDLISIYKPKFDANPNDLTLLKKITKILDKKRCTDSDLFLTATENLHKLEPSANSAYLMALRNMKEENYLQAIDYLKEALSLYDMKDKRPGLITS
jgi:tetratricopeptide (TPR) repeat protein